MKWTLIGIIALVTITAPLVVLGWQLGYEQADSRWEYKTQYLQEELDSCHLRDKFQGLRH
jgi:hypothetical protein